MLRIVVAIAFPYPSRVRRQAACSKAGITSATTG